MRIAYRTLGFLIAALVAVQAASHAWSSAGLGLYVAEGHTVDSSLLESPTLPFPEALGFMIHGLNGMYIIPAVALALLVVSFFVHLGGAVLFAAITLGLVAIQVTLGLLGHGLPTLGLLHGLNAILLVNLAGAAWRSLRFLRGHGTIHRLERWQTTYLPVFAAWAAVVVLVLPPAFGFS